MALFPRLELRQSQSLVMTPQLQQAIKLLQLSNIDLAAYVETELERNPLLERASQEDPDSAPKPDSETADANDGFDAPEPKTLDLAEDGGLKDVSGKLDTDMESLYPEDRPANPGSTETPAGMTDSGWASLNAGKRGGGFDSDFDGFESTLSEEQTLHGALTDQLQIALFDPACQMIGLHLIDMTSDDGYLRGDLQSVADMLGAPLELVENTLEKMQDFDPPGVMARDLKECLGIQLREKGAIKPAMAALLDNLDLLAKHDAPKLMKATGLGADGLAQAIAEIRSLNPKPGLAYGSIIIQPVVPDVFVREGQDGGWAVELNSETLPRVLLNRQYYATVSGSARSEEEKTYLSECLGNASWLVKSLDQRARTILKTAREIVRQQDAFLTKGVQHLRPLNLKTVADAISMHESTISRVTSNKYMATPRGVFEMKYFFSSAIASVTGGEAYSAEAVRQRVRNLIDNEAPNAILSDDKLVNLLRASGIDIARRTIAKYREAMGIPSSVQRRREKQHAI